MNTDFWNAIYIKRMKNVQNGIEKDVGCDDALGLFEVEGLLDGAGDADGGLDNVGTAPDTLVRRLPLLSFLRL
eukprot:CAMPEP_0172489010 /NCGR_PEP_ID=MMETSP1066-20121228/18750_1 /TAXON_ID=671091 /ORGANISM="Coscinodiscus wailesii, Strain CCMP2513" /LENGTH=72 /DNA_ID=CAMNT_0013256575 /DNA_START=183 /DNA_END=401 /DNA_ORIENTATION=-